MGGCVEPAPLTEVPRAFVSTKKALEVSALRPHSLRHDAAVLEREAESFDERAAITGAALMPDGSLTRSRGRRCHWSAGSR